MGYKTKYNGHTRQHQTNPNEKKELKYLLLNKYEN